LDIVSAFCSFFLWLMFDFFKLIFTNLPNLFHNKDAE